LNRQHDYGAVRDDQLRALDHIGVFSKPLNRPAAERARLADPRDASADLAARVRAYLHVNCSVCHVGAGGGNSKMELASATPEEKMNLIGARPQHDTFGIANAMLVAPGDADRSVLVHRLSRRGRGQMPPLVSNQVDDRAVRLFRDWIATLKPGKAIVRNWQMDDLLPALSDQPAERSVASGKTAFRETGCVQCHRFAGEGGSVGPDLTAVAKRVAARELLESILLPSKVVADEYATYAIETADGQIVTGRIEREDSDVVVVRSYAADQRSVEIEKENVLERKRLPTSNMPSGTVDVLEKEQVLDLLAYLLSAPAEAAGKNP
jgi:putative heme-binding domain-containing protein